MLARLETSPSPEKCLVLKFPIDDTTVAEIVPRNALGDTQTAVKVVENWSKAQKVQLNADKCKVMVIDYKR